MRACAIALLLACGLAQAAGQNIVDDGWATAAGYWFSGRLTGDNHQPAKADSGKLDTLYRSTRLLFASSAEGEVGWSVGALAWSSRADDHGYWALAANQKLALAPGWHEIGSSVPPSSKAGLLVHDARNRYGLISDLDDTIVVSDVPNKLRLLKNSLSVPPESREAVAGMAGLYARLAAGNPNPEATPLFYLSASPKQLTDGIRRFLAKNRFPRGVLLLKEVGHESRDPLSDQEAYKLDRLRAIFRAFPDVRFDLFGDDGERDPEIYAAMQREFPQQVGKVWIRRVSPDPQRARYPGQQDTAALLAGKRPAAE
ncbi:phosphatase domain-containing protein [Chitinilyticum litopenaei]|uniref:phosphatase domain-containing protein n=1 Tax=Chitinilyticum litopenaei TaxID=1121276 RepID=UPI00042876FC|nr:phosphatase domain-containing protein [Chitinilyticum litopenaei]